MNHSKEGFCDGLLGRKAQSPPTWKESADYLQGFLRGQKKRNDENITIVIERYNI